MIKRWGDEFYWYCPDCDRLSMVVSRDYKRVKAMLRVHKRRLHLELFTSS